MKFKELREQKIEQGINGYNNGVKNEEMEKLRLEALDLLDDDLSPVSERETKIEELKELRESLIGQADQEKKNVRNI